MYWGDLLSNVVADKLYACWHPRRDKANFACDRARIPVYFSN